MNTPTAVKCPNGIFGTFDKSSCPASCEWQESCKYLTTAPNPDSAHRVRNPVGYDKNSFRCDNESSNESNPNDDSESTEGSVATDNAESSFEQLKTILIYLVNLDDNTARALIDIIRNPHISQAEIARRRGVSRQRINTSLLHAVRKHPELSSVFCVCVQRYTILGNRYQCKPYRRPARQPDISLPGLDA